MLPANVLKQYIDESNRILNNADLDSAKMMVKRILSIFGSEYDGLKSQLSRYTNKSFATSLSTMETFGNSDVNDLDDLRLLCDRLEVELQKADSSQIENYNNMRTEIFISHRTTDAPVADMIKDFLVSTGIPNDKIFCSSLPGNDVKEQISVEVKERLKKSAVNILLLSKAYYESAYCLNEAGIAWYLDDVKAIPIGLPEIDHNNMLGFLNSDYILRRLDKDADISYIYDEVQERTKSTPVKHVVVGNEAKKLKEKYLQYITNREVKSQEASEESTKQANTTVEIERDEGILLVYAAYTDGRIIVINSISNSGPIVGAGRFQFNRSDTLRESARWKEAVFKLKRYGYVEDAGYKEEVFCITNAGFKAADKVKAEWDIDTDKDPGEYLD